MDSLGFRIKYLRDNHIPPMTQEELSAASGIKMGTLSNYEANKRNASHKALRKIAFVFGIDWKRLDPVITPKFNLDLKKEDNCEKFCDSLNDFEKNTLKKYCSISKDRRIVIYKKWDDLVTEEQKKSDGYGNEKTVKDNPYRQRTA